ncbi:hypothetical protein [Streptomyces cupreus]|uniref:Uncharacterized protein n=1 Tax=Streptomyces cupreus TaxID=2759956 RepID=A0A7X1MCY2_9ACTN|nr:hypothetical protein [Streptomyces cupreus]
MQNVTAVAAGTICNDADWPATADAYQADVTKNRAEYPLTAGMPAQRRPQDARGTECGDRLVSRFLATGERPGGDGRCD